jgi:hypothetical protein
MDSQWFEALFKGDYNNVMNNVADYVNYSHSASIDGDYSDNHNFDNDDDDSDDEGELFWKREFDRHKLVLYTTNDLSLYYNAYIYKEPCMYSYNTGMR